MQKVPIINRIIKGIGAGAFGQVITILVQLIGVPILLHYWGTQLYGEWLILSAIPAYLSMVDLGFTQSAANDMTSRVARGDRNGSLTIFQSLSALVYAIILAGSFISALLLAFFPIERLHITTVTNNDVRWILWLLALSVLFQLADGVCHAGFRSHGEYAFHKFFSSLTIFLQQVALWISAIFGYGPVLAALLMFLIRVISVISLTFILFTRHKSVQPGIKFVDFNVLSSLITPALANVALPLAQGINIQGMVLVVGALLGPIAVVIFSTLRTLSRFALQMVLTISYAFEPELAAALGKDDKKELKRLFFINQRLGFSMAFGTLLSLFFLGSWIINLWTHGNVTMNTTLFNWLLLSAFASVIWYGGFNLLKSGNFHIKLALWYVFVSLIAIVFAFILAKVTNQLSNIGLSLVVMDSLMVVYVYKSVAHFLNSSYSEMIRESFNLKLLIHNFSIFLRRTTHPQYFR